MPLAIQFTLLTISCVNLGPSAANRANLLVFAISDVIYAWIYETSATIGSSEFHRLLV